MQTQMIPTGTSKAWNKIVNQMEAEASVMSPPIVLTRHSIQRIEQRVALLISLEYVITYKGRARTYKVSNVRSTVSKIFNCRLTMSFQTNPK